MTIRTERAFKQTTGATQTNVHTSPTALTAAFIIFVSAHEAATSDQQIWAFHASRSDSDNSVISTAIHAQAGDAGGATWAVEVVEGTDTLEINVTGEAAHTIDWTVAIQTYD